VQHLFFKGIRGTHEPRDLQWRQMRDLRRLDPDGLLRKTFTPPVRVRVKAPEFRDYPAHGYIATL
jgi:hypothetical protein